jgi:hypothetical protein
LKHPRVNFLTFDRWLQIKTVIAGDPASRRGNLESAVKERVKAAAEAAARRLGAARIQGTRRNTGGLVAPEVAAPGTGYKVPTTEAITADRKGPQPAA